jgi:hypothetical protein
MAKLIKKHRAWREGYMAGARNKRPDTKALSYGDAMRYMAGFWAGKEIAILKGIQYV